MKEFLIRHGEGLIVFLLLIFIFCVFGLLLYKSQENTHEFRMECIKYNTPELCIGVTK